MTAKMMGRTLDNGLHVRLASSTTRRMMKRKHWDKLARQHVERLEEVADTVYSVEWSSDGATWHVAEQHGTMSAAIKMYRSVSMTLKTLRGDVVAAANSLYPDVAADGTDGTDGADDVELFDVTERNSIPFVGKEEHVCAASVPLEQAQVIMNNRAWAHKKFDGKPARRRDYWTISIERA